MSITKSHKRGHFPVTLTVDNESLIALINGDIKLPYPAVGVEADSDDDGGYLLITINLPAVKRDV